MFLTNTKRIIKSGAVGFWRNAFVSFSSVAVMAATLFVIGSLVFIGAILSSSLSELRNKVDVNVYMAADATSEQALLLKSQIENLPETERVEYVTEEAALKEFREKHKDDPLILQALDELGANPLGAVLNIKAKEPSQYSSISAFLNQKIEASGSGIDKVNYLENKEAIDKLTSLIQATRKLGSALSIVLSVISIMIAFNTIRLAIYTSREEIAVMQLVGASNYYVRGPFVIEGIFSGAISAAAVLLLFFPLLYWIAPSTTDFFGGLNLYAYYLSNFGQIAFLLFASGIALGAISSYLAVRKYLKV